MGIRNTININDVLYKLLEAKSFQIIADELGVSKTSISNAVKKLEKEIGEKNVKTLLEMAAAAKKVGISFVQMLSCARIYKILEKQNLDDDQVYDLLSEIIPKINDQTKVSELFDAAKIVLDLEESAGMSLDEIENYCNTKRQEITSLDEQSKEANEKTEQSVSLMNHTLKENNVTAENLNNYVKARDYLEENGADVNDLQAVTNMVITSSKNKYDSETTIAQLSEKQSLNQRNADLVKQNKQILEQNQAQIKESQKQDDIIETKRHILEPVEKFEKIGITPNHLLALYQKVEEIGEKTDIAPADIIEKFTKDIAQYEQKTGFDNIINRQRQEIESKNQNIEDIKEEETKVTARIKTKRKEEIKLDAALEECKNTINKINQDIIIAQKEYHDALEEHGKRAISHFGSKLTSAMDDVIKNLKYEHTRNMSDLVEKISEISKKSEELGHHKHLKVLSGIVKGEGTPSEVYSSMIMLITGTQMWLKKNNINDIYLLNQLENLKKQFEEKMSKNAQAA